MTIKVELPGIDGGNVISLEVRRRAMFKDEGCAHMSIVVQRDLTTVECRTCGEKNLSPVEWISKMVEEWFRIKNLIAQYKTAVARFEAKQRTRCEHCRKITKVNPATAAEVRAFQRGVRQEEGKNL